jgi:hypothetical protein
MFIDSRKSILDLSLQRSDMNGSTCSLAQHCAPLERETLVDREVYKHLAPLEPKQCLLNVTTQERSLA